MRTLTARDALSRSVVRVTSEERPQSGDAAAPREAVFAVFAESPAEAESSVFLGLVSGRKAALYSQRIFEDLLFDGVLKVLPDTSLESVADLLGSQPDGIVAVVDPSGEFLGAVTRESLLAVMREHQLQMLSQSLEMQEQQRRLLAAEIHDGIAQYAAGARMQLEAFISAQRDVQQAARRYLDEALRLLDEISAEARHLIFEIHPTVLEHGGLVVAVNSLIEQHQRQAELSVHFECDEPLGVLPKPVELAAYRVIQEALNNVVQHSGSRRAQVVIQRSERQLRIQVRDWGQGIREESPRGDSYGLRAMRQRTEALGGSLTILTDARPGVQISAELPL